MFTSEAGVHHLLSRLSKVHRTGPGRWSAACPSHPDANPSLSITLKNKQKLLLHCHAGCSPESVLAAIGLTWKDILPPGEERDRVVAATYDYRDEQKTLLFQVVRFAPKDFRQRRPDGKGGWIWNMDGVRRVLYGLPELLAADPAATVILPEGEKDVDRLRSLGYVATCNPGGAGKWRAEYSQVLSGRTVIVIADADEPGRAHAHGVAESLVGVAASVAVLELPDAKDFSSFLERGGTIEQLDSLLAELPLWTGSAPVDSPQEAAAADEWTPKPYDPPNDWLSPAGVLRASPQPKARFKSTILAINKASARNEDRRGLPTGALVVLQGDPDAGKTGLGLQDVVHIACDNETVAVIFTPDQGREWTAIRVGALLGLNAQKLEDRDGEEIARLDAAIRGRRIFLPDDSSEENTVEAVIAAAERIRPDIPHVLFVDSLQEARANGKTQDASERERVVANVRACQKATRSAAVAWLVIATSQTTKASQSRDPKRRQPAIMAGAETAKIGFATQLVVHLDGDPGRGKGRAAVVKNKLGGPKPTFGLRLDPNTTHLEEIDEPQAAQEHDDAQERQAEEASSKAQSKILDAMRRYLPGELAFGRPGISENRLAKKAGIGRTKQAFDNALDALAKRKVLEEVQTNNGHFWRWKDGREPSDA